MTNGVPTFVLIHSPLVGPFTWEPVAAALRSRGTECLVPSLASMLTGGPPYWRRAVSLVAEAIRAARLSQPIVLVAHSGTGSLLPAIGAGIDHRVAAYLFVDAPLPRGGTSALDRAEPGFAALVRSLAQDGWLPRWNEWWPADAIRTHLPDDGLRAKFLEELRPIPLALFEEVLPAITGWPNAPCAYLQLSAAYDDAVAEARAAGWSVAQHPSHHLAMLTEPTQIADAMLQQVTHGHAGSARHRD